MMVSPLDRETIEQLTKGLHLTKLALDMLGIKLDAIVLHNTGDTRMISAAFRRVFDFVPRDDGRTDTRLNGVQIMDRIDI